MENKVGKYLEAHGFIEGRLITFSKSLYREAYPKHIVLFNACLFNTKGEEVWWGDVDLTRDWKVFYETARALNETLILTPETPYRFIGLKETLKDMQTTGDIAIVSHGNGAFVFDAPNIIIVKGKNSLKKRKYGIWVFPCCEKDDKNILQDVLALLHE